MLSVDQMSLSVTGALHFLAWAALSLGVFLDVASSACVLLAMGSGRRPSAVLLLPLLFSVPGALYIVGPAHLKVLAALGLAILHVVWQAVLPSAYECYLSRRSLLRKAVSTDRHEEPNPPAQ